MPQLFTALGVYGVGFGILALPVGLLVGPHVLAALLGHIAIGIASLFVARGLSNKRTWAWWCGIILAATIMLLVIVALIQSLQDADVGGVVFYSIMASFMLVVIVTTIALRKKYLHYAGSIQ